MIYRFALACALLIEILPAVAADLKLAPQQVQEPSICWDPDVEFPVPCDDED